MKAIPIKFKRLKESTVQEAPSTLSRVRKQPKNGTARKSQSTPTKLKKRLKNNTLREIQITPGLVTELEVTPQEDLPSPIELEKELEHDTSYYKLYVPGSVVVEQLLIWLANPGSFLRIEGNSRLENQPLLLQVFNFLRDAEKSNILTQVRRRLLLLLLSNLSKKLNSYKRLTENNLQLLLKLLDRSGALGESQDLIQKRIIDWKAGGVRYETYTKELGGLGSLLLLPYSVSSYEYVLAKETSTCC